MLLSDSESSVQVSQAMGGYVTEDDRDVDVVKLITKGSIEEDMYSLGQMKLALDEAVAGEEAEERVEREMKMSLMNAVLKKLTTDEDVEMKDGAAAGAINKN